MIEIPTHVLVDVAKRCKPFTRKSQISPQLGHVFFLEGFAVASTGTSGVLVFLPEVPLEQFSVECEILGRLVSNTKSQSVVVDRTKSGGIVLTADTYKIKLESCDIRLFPLFEIPDTNIPFPGGLWSVLQTLYQFVGKDETQQGTRGVYVSNDGFAYSTDVFRLARLPFQNEAAPTLFPDTLLKSFIEGPAPEAYAVTRSAVWMFWDQQIAYGLLPQTDFPNARAAFDNRAKVQPLSVVSIDPDKMVSALERLMLFATQHRERADASLTLDALNLRWVYDNRDAEESIPVSASAPVTNFKVNLRLLSDCLNSDIMEVKEDHLLFRNNLGREVICSLVV